jgi:hypothetical protein
MVPGFGARCFEAALVDAPDVAHPHARVPRET